MHRTLVFKVGAGDPWGGREGMLGGAADGAPKKRNQLSNIPIS